MRARWARATACRGARVAAAALATIVAVAVLFAGVGCGGGGGGGGGGPTQPQPGITFTGSGVAAPAVRLTRGAGTSGSVLELEVRADQLPGVYGLAFDLVYPSGVLRFEGFAEGDFLGRNGPVQTSLQLAEPSAGLLVVGHSRLGDTGTVAGSGLLLTLRFTAVASGSGSFTFSANRLFDARGDQIRGPAWGGGTVQVTR